MANRYGGVLPDVKYGFELSAEPPATISATAPIEQGELLKVSGTAADGSGYKVADAADGDDLSTEILVMAKHRIDDPAGVLGIKVFGLGAPTVVRLKYDGAAPTLGQSIKIAAGNVRKVTGQAFALAKRSRIMKVSTATTEVEVLVW